MKKILDPSGDEESDSDSESFDEFCGCEEKFVAVNERLNEIIKMLKPNKNNNLDTIDEDEGRNKGIKTYHLKKYLNYIYRCFVKRHLKIRD